MPVGTIPLSVSMWQRWTVTPPSWRGFGVATVVALADAAPAGAVWTTGTVRDLLAGSGVALQPAGTAEVGAAGQQPVFAAGRG